MTLLKDEAEKLGIILTKEQLNQFSIYKDYLLEYNSHTNLTSIKDDDDILIKHFLDSIAFLKFIKIEDNSKLIDVGTGAGFPGMPIKIANPLVNITLVDSLNKRITFLKSLSEKLNIQAEILHSRAEELSLNKNYRGKFDYVVSRAVAPLNILAEYCLPYLKIGGCFIVLKGFEITQELENAKNAIDILGAVLESSFRFELPFEKGKRSILVLRKVKETNSKYPRKNSKISSEPL